MEFMTGVKKKEDISVKTLLEIPEGTEVKLEGAVHIIRDMGEVAFVILRKSEGLVQCVYEEGSVDFPLKDLKEESAVAVTGTVKKEDRAPGGVEVRLQTITVLSEPTEPMPLAVNKWKMNTSLEAMLNMRPIALRNVRERAKFRIQEGVVRAFRDFLHSQGFTEIHTQRSARKAQRVAQTSSSWNTSTARQSLHRARSSTNRCLLACLTVFLKSDRSSVLKNITPNVI